MATKQFAQGLKTEGLLVENQSEARLNDGREMRLGGFLAIDQEKFNQLSDEKILEFRKKGWLPLMYAILFSATNWQNLVELLAAKK